MPEVHRDIAGAVGRYRELGDWQSRAAQFFGAGEDASVRFSDITADALFPQYISQVSSEIQRLLREKERISCLEVGAGVSYPSGNFSSPWLSRYLCNASPWRDRLDITVTDKRAPLIGEATPDWTFKGAGVRATSNKIDIYGFPPDPVKNIELQNLSGFSLSIPGDGVGSSERWHIRPSLDPEFERAVFQLEVLGDIDLFTLDSHFPEKKFDIIYCSFFPAGAQEIDRQIAPALQRALSPEGVVVFDKANSDIRRHGRNAALQGCVYRIDHDEVSIVSGSPSLCGFSF